MSSQTPTPDFDEYDWQAVCFFERERGKEREKKEKERIARRKRKKKIFFFHSCQILFLTTLIPQGGPSAQVGLGINLVTLCPTAHPTYTLGTYAIGIYGITPASVRIDLEYADEVRSFILFLCDYYTTQKLKIQNVSFQLNSSKNKQIT